MTTTLRKYPRALLLIATLSASTAYLSPEDDARLDWPCLAMTHNGGMSRDNKSKSGLLLAVWEDGTMLFAARQSAPGERLLVGRAEKAEVSNMLEAVKAAGFFEEKREHYAVPDSASTTIRVRNGKNKGLHTWHERLLPGFGGDINTDTVYRQFIRMWKKTRGAVEALPLVEVHRFEELAVAGRFRGYIADNAWKTAWMSDKAWRP